MFVSLVERVVCSGDGFENTRPRDILINMEHVVYMATLDESLCRQYNSEQMYDVHFVNGDSCYIDEASHQKLLGCLEII